MANAVQYLRCILALALVGWGGDGWLGQKSIIPSHLSASVSSHLISSHLISSHLTCPGLVASLRRPAHSLRNVLSGTDTGTLPVFWGDDNFICRAEIDRPGMLPLMLAMVA
eukprot:822961-Rhodomonas_salina.4